MNSKVSSDTLYEAVREVLLGNQCERHKFLETVELQISLKNYEPQKDKHFAGTVRCAPLSLANFCLRSHVRELSKHPWRFQPHRQSNYLTLTMPLPAWS
uniref:Uncharacterized protein n=1 Tax=Aotus nancymaae TaxID=37293 RepID=A0A2K5CHK5_AOTNA